MLQQLKACQKETHMVCWVALYMQVFRRKKVLRDDQRVSDTNPLFELGMISYTPRLELYPVQHTSPHRTHAHTPRGKHVKKLILIS